jgi:hypothetical protein
VHWIVVDDGPEVQLIDFARPNWTMTVVYPRPVWQAGQNTQARNLMEGVRHVLAGDKLVIIEDDDMMHPDWLSTVDYWLKDADLVGEKFARYYNVKTKRYRRLKNDQHASLCCTAMKGAAIQAFERELKPGVQFIDIQLWRNFKGRKALYDSRMVVGIKGMAGRGGIGMGHKDDFAGDVDNHGTILRQWAGANADLYG